MIEPCRVARHGGVGADRADAIVSTLAVAEVDGAIERIAIGLGPGLRSLDAIHLAPAVVAGTSLRAFVCNDVHLARAADDLGLEARRS